MSSLPLARPKWGMLLAAGALGSAAATRAEAQAPVTSTDGAAPVLGPFAYEAPPLCPDRGRWLPWVAAQLDEADVARVSARVDGLIEQLVVEPAGTSAAIRFRGSGHARAIEGSDCDEVLSAAALIVAIALRSMPEQGTRAELEPPRDASPPSAPPAAPVVEPAAGGRRTLAPRDGEGVDAPRPSLSTAAPGERWGVTLGVGAEANDWLGPWPAGVLDAGVEALAPSRGWSLRAAAAWSSAEQRVGTRRAEFQFWGGHLDLCPLSLGGDATWRWTSCLEGHLGLLRGEGDEGSALAASRTRRSIWAGLQASTRLQTPPLWAVRLEAELGLTLPLVRRAFHFGVPEQLVFQDPAVGVVGRVGLLIPLAGQP